MTKAKNNNNAFDWGSTPRPKNDTKQQEQKLLEVLEKLIEPLNNDKYKELSNDLIEIYSKDKKYRHSYSAINNHLIKITQKNTQKLSQIAENIKEIYQAIPKEEKYYEASLHIFKLYDHINLVVVQLSSIFEIKENIDNINIQAQVAKEEMGKIWEEVKKTQTNYVAILGIFAAIILAFVSGLVFSSSVLQSIDKASIYKLSLITVTIGFFITNILLFLFNFIKSIIKTNENKSILDPHISYFNLVAIILILTLFAVSVSHETIYKKLESNSTINVNTANINFSSKR